MTKVRKSPRVNLVPESTGGVDELVVPTGLELVL